LGIVGLTLVCKGLGLYIPKGYIYFAMAFSAFVEMINLRVRRVTAPVHRHESYA
jgi:predicted tellurium resistance membrane protein TerC